jgi:hypothetical protein
MRITAMFVAGTIAGKLFVLVSAWIDLPGIRHLILKSH